MTKAVTVFGFQGEQDEEHYLHWLKAHPNGYVLNSYRNIDYDYLPLHRTTCKTISQYKKATHGLSFTGNRYIKICAEHKRELLHWIQQQGGRDFSDYCAKCKPYGDFEGLKDKDNLDNYIARLESAVQRAAGNATARQARLKTAKKRPEKMLVLTTVFKRNPDVIAEVRERANGQCERCGKDAPFYRRSDNSPFLEVHHLIPLAQGGDDSVENAIAVCPNCHRQAHFG